MLNQDLPLSVDSKGDVKLELIETKYGKDFKIPELPHVLREQLMANEIAANILATKSANPMGTTS
jgi:hypothetical protein